MKTLWNPWRMKHVLGHTPKASHCLFEPTCKERSYFMTTLAEVRTIPEHIELTFDRLLPDFNQLHSEIR
jgi:hypothetical protein